MGIQSPLNAAPNFFDEKRKSQYTRNRGKIVEIKKLAEEVREEIASHEVQADQWDEDHDE